jgi:diguanylate cyclase (GGDEF)-like protein
MTGVLVALAAFATWSNISASRAAAKVGRASDLLESYQRARFDVSQEESLKRQYRLEPSAGVLAAHDEISADLTATLKLLVASDTSRRTRLTPLLALQEVARTGVLDLFAANDRGDTTAATRIDDTIVDPALSALDAEIYADANAQTAITDRAIADLRRSDRGLLMATPVAFALGLLVLLLFLRISRDYQRTIETRAMRDALTGLPNRACFYDRGAQALLGEERRNSTTSVLVIDLDRFKELNDTLGHRYGDELLCQIGPRLSPLLRASDTLARLGGDEFAILLPDAGGAIDAHDIAERLIERLQEPFVLDTFTFTIGASCGHATSPQDGIDVDALLQHADVAMYVAKGAHSGPVAYHQALDVNTPKRLAILSELPSAIRNDELVVYYQPKSDVSTGTVVGVEALVRWNHPTLGLIPPDEFIPGAEQSGLIKPLTAWVLDRALAQCHHWNKTPGRTAITVSVNVSARNLLDEKFPTEVLRALERRDVAAELLVLEVTETAIMADPPRAHAVLLELHGLGVKLSIDDFGTGYSSLSYLKLLPVDELKIDKSFVQHMVQEPNDLTIVRSVIDLAHNLGLGTVAEGIEDQTTLEQLAVLGCDVAQGYHLARPMTADALGAWLTAILDEGLLSSGRARNVRQ